MKMVIRLSIILSAIGIGVLITSTSAHAINTSDFDAGRIIDDALFYDKGGMNSVAEVQAFLDAHVPECDTQGTQLSGYGNLTNAQYAQQVKGWPGPPYVCLDNYQENPNTGKTSFEMGGGAFQGGISAAQIIYDAAQKYSINPKVLLVFLRKESVNLFSDSWPMKSQYKYAMGYACPDSGPNYSASCVESKSGFYKQVTLAAWQLRYYYDNMGTYNYSPGRWNTIQYSTDPACGTKDVYIQNYATASLYIYTPYTPRDAALNAYPGEVTCGAYGNRNFWFYWQEWFGTTKIDGNLLRSTTNATVYLVSDNIKYPIPNSTILNNLNKLGKVGYVSDSYLNAIPTGQIMGRFFQSPGGTIYYYDSSIKLSFATCAMVADYGGSCGNIPTLTQPQVDAFITGSKMTNYIRTTEGESYYIKNGIKREVFDDKSLTEMGLTANYHVLSTSVIDQLDFGVPITRNNTLIKSSDGNQYVVVNNGIYKLTTSKNTRNVFSIFDTGSLRSQSVKVLTIADTIDDFIRNQDGIIYAITPTGISKVIDSTNVQNVNIPTLPQDATDLLKISQSTSAPVLVKDTTSATIYALVAGEKRPLVSMDDLSSITGEGEPNIIVLTGSSLKSIPEGNIIVGLLRMVKTPSSATVYMTDGYNQLIPMSSFDSAVDLGSISSKKVISDSILSKYTITNSVLSTYVTCNSVQYVAMNGALYKLTLSDRTPIPLTDLSCRNLSKNNSLPKFILDPTGTIYYVENNVLRPISSWSKYLSMREPNDQLISVSNQTVRLFTIGSRI